MTKVNTQVMIALDARWPPDLAQKMALGHHLAAIGQQHAKQAILDWCQLQHIALTGHHASREINSHVAEFNDRRRALDGPALPPQERTRTRSQFANAERLGQIVVGTDIERLDFILFVRTCREHENRHLRPATQMADEVDAVAIGQAEIEHHQSGLLLARFNQPLRRRCRLKNSAAFFFECRAYKTADQFFVLDDNDGRRMLVDSLAGPIGD